MQKRPFMIIVLAILLVQPVVVGLSMPFSFSLVEPTRALAQDAGTRIELGDLANHVPVIIDGTTDFVSQSWPGSGTPADPYVISGLNLTQDYADGSIYIRNTNASFVIRDCYIYQGLAGWAISIVNTTAARIEYTTIESPLGGVYCDNANNTVLDHSVVAASSTYALSINYSNDCEFHNNDISTNYSIFYAYYSQNIVSSYNTYSGNPGWYSMFMRYSNASSFTFDTIMTGYSPNFQYCYNLSFVNVRLDGSGGINIANGYNLEVIRCNFTVTDIHALSAFVFPNILISDSYFQSTGGEGIYLGIAENITITDSVVEHTLSNGIYISNSDNIYINGVSILDSGGIGIDIQNSDNVTLDNLDVVDTGGVGLHIVSCDNGTLTNANFADVTTNGVDIITGANWTITDNTFMNIGDDGITHLAGVNLVIMRNYLDFVGDGIIIENDANATVIDNHITEAAGDGLYVESCFQAQVVDNTVNVAEIGLFLIDSDNVTVEGNQFLENMEMGIYYEQCDNGVIRENDITGGPLGGITMTSSLNAEIVNNTLVDCGIVTGGLGSIAEFLHVIEDNMVNGLPVYYNPGVTGVDILASDYGQVLLVNNTWMTVHDSTFGLATMPVEVGYSSECTLWNLDTTGNYVGIGLLMASNITVHNITHSGGSDSSGIAAFSTDNVTILDSEFTNCRDAMGAVWGTGVNDFYIGDSLFDGNDVAVMLNQGTDILISGNQILNTAAEAIRVDSSISDYIRVLNNDILNASTGIYSSGADNWTIMDNTVMYCTFGIHISGESADDANITLNTVENNHWGIYFSSGDTGSVTNNSIRWNTGVGVYLSSSSGTDVQYNTFVSNLGGNGYDSSAGSFWDDGVDTGNWWSDYTPPAPYQVDGDTQDRYPLEFLPTTPIISEPQDIYYAEGSEDNEILWYALDDSLKNWVVTIDGGAWTSDAWNFDNITVNIDGLAYGTHTIDIMLWDVDLNNVTDTVTVHVFDGTPPTISNVPNAEAFTTGTGQTLSWDVSDLHPETYTAYLDGEVWDTGTWTSGTLEISIDGMTEGEHTLLMVVSDIDGNTAQDPVEIRVIVDTDDPTINSPDDFSYLEGETGNVIVWEPADDNPALFEVTYGSSVFVDGEWSGSRVTVNVDGLTNGTHTFRLTVYDGSGNSVEDTVVVTVTTPIPDEIPPPSLDLGLIGLVVAVIGVSAIVVVVIVLFIKKKKAPY